MRERINKDDYYLNIAEVVAQRSTCLRRMYGAVIVKNDEIISTGYNGAPRGRANCSDTGFCLRKMLQIPSGERYELCKSVHGEANAIISASRRDMIGSSLYLGKIIPAGENSDTEFPECCSMCKRLILNAGIIKVISRNSHGKIRVIIPQEEWISE